MTEVNSMQEKERSPLSLLENMEMIDDRLCGCMVPIQETKDHRNMVYYKDLLSLSEDNCISVDEALDMTIKENCIPRKGLVVVIEEWRPLCNPEILTQFSDVVLFKESTNSVPYRICDHILENYINSGENQIWLDILEEACFNEEFAMSILEGNAGAAADMTDPAYNTELAKMQALKQQKAAGNNTPQPTQTQKKLMTGTAAENNPTVQKFMELKKQKEGAAGNQQQGNTTPPKSAPPSQQQQGWLSRMWSSIKNWWGNNFGNGKGNATQPTNKYAQAGANLANDQVQTFLNRGAAWLSNLLQSKGIDADVPIDLARDYASAKAPEAVNKLMNYAQTKMGG